MIKHNTALNLNILIFNAVCKFAIICKFVLLFAVGFRGSLTTTSSFALGVDQLFYIFVIRGEYMF
jgi:fluoride ion exporter CrcB/FEX